MGCASSVVDETPNNCNAATIDVIRQWFPRSSWGLALSSENCRLGLAMLAWYEATLSAGCAHRYQRWLSAISGSGEGWC